MAAVPDCGHDPMLDQPDLFARLTAEALESAVLKTAVSETAVSATGGTGV